MKLAALLLILSLAFSLPVCISENQNPGLNDLTGKHGFQMGACLSYSDLKNKAYLEIVKTHFDSVTMTNEMKAYSLLDQRASKKAKDGMPVMNYSKADAMVGWAKANGLKVRGHVLVWDAHMNDWFFREEYNSKKPYADAETIKKRTEYYITEVITHFEEKFPGVVFCWDVVNEAVGDNITEYNVTDPRRVRTKRSGGDNLFYTLMGPDYVEHAFLYARQAVDALGADIGLYYNDYNAYFPDKAEAILNLAESINTFKTDDSGNFVKLIDGIGMQGYIGGYGTQSGCLESSHLGMIKNQILGYHAKGLDVQITEMAVRNYETEYADKHADFYTKLFCVFTELNSEGESILNSVSIWGLVDCPNLPKDNYSYKLNSPYGGLISEKMEYKEVFNRVYTSLWD